MNPPLRTLAAALLTTILAPFAIAQGWAGEWNLNETSGTTANDISGNNNHGTLQSFTGNPWVAGRFGNALQFDGVDDFVEVGIQGGLPVYDGLGSPYSVAFWVKAPAQNDKRVYSEGSTTSNQPIVTFGTGRTSRSNTDKFQIYIRNRQNRIVCEQYSSLTVFDDTWHHFAFVDVSGQITMYVDGVKDPVSFQYATPPGTANFGTWDMNRASIGAVLRNSACCFLTGTIDDMRVYRYALSAADIQLMMLGVAQQPCSASTGYYGLGCAGGLDIAATGNPTLGGVVNLLLTGGTPNANALLLVGAGVNPIDLSVAGFTGCIAYTDIASSILAPIGALNANGDSATIPVVIPNQASLACLIGVLQGVSISGTALQLSRAALLQPGK